MTRSAPGWLRRLYAALRRPGARTTVTTVITTTVPGTVTPPTPPPPDGLSGAVAHDPLEIAERRLAGLDWHIAALEADRDVAARR